MKCAYITISMFHVLLIRYKGSFMHVGVSEISKKVSRSTKAAKKVQVFPVKPSQFTKESLKEFKKNLK